MNPFVNERFLLGRLGLFLILFLGLSLFFTIPQARDAHSTLFCKIIEPIHNVLNPNIQVSFNKETRTDRRHYGTSISLFDIRNRGTMVNRKGYRNLNNPDIIKYPNLHPMILVPSILLICLIVLTPIPLRKKLLATFIGMILFYLMTTFFLAHAFELSYTKTKDLSLDSFWHVLITPFGSTNSELIYINIFLIWGIVTGPAIVNRYKEHLHLTLA